jgi:hypothetical protein
MANSASRTCLLIEESGALSEVLGALASVSDWFASKSWGLLAS